MHKLLIIGNGFDRAHGLKTSYNDFLDYLWKLVISNEHPIVSETLAYYNRNNRLASILNNSSSYKEFNNVLDSQTTNLSRSNINLSGIGFKKTTIYNPFDDWKETIIEFKSSFFKLLIDHYSKVGWSNIEHLYYTKVKEYHIKNQVEQIKSLNQDFEVITNLFEEYLKKEVESKINIKHLKNKEGLVIRSIDESNILRNLTKVSTEENSLLHELTLKKEGRVLTTSEVSKALENHNLNKISQNLIIVDFNYTSNFSIYNTILNTKSINYDIETEYIQIHGKVGNENNPINFGYGDEMDEEYKAIENRDDNEFFRHIKSFRYLLNSNYRNLISSLEREVFQVIILGHSCGLSDRTLLNTIFEHDNCISIKIFYHKDISTGTDNYNEIANNISRHFNNKIKMREKILSKDLCKPLSQDYQYSFR